MNPTYDEIVKANSMRGNEIKKTPLIHSPTFSSITGSEIYLKAEFRQRTGSFKIRGAYYKIKTLSDEEKKRGVVAASAGNHGQGVAFASALEKIPCTIVMPKNASPAKVSATRGYGATVILEGINYDESSSKAKEIAKETGATIIHAFNDPQVIAAQGVIGLEILEQLPDVDEVYVPIGGGGLAAGILIAIKEKNPNVKIIGCQPQQNHLIQGWRNFEESAKPDLFLKRENVVDDWVSADNNEAFSVVKEVFTKDKLLISPSSAAVYACMKKYPIDGDACVVGIFADDGRKFKSVYATQNIMSEDEFENSLKDAKHMSELAY